MSYWYAPLPDITLWELALVLGVMMAADSPEFERLIEELPPEARRHFHKDD